MARPKPRRPKPGRGLPPPYRPTPEEDAEDERIRAELIVEQARIDAILVIKRAEAAERARIKAEARAFEARAFEACEAETALETPNPSTMWRR